MTNPDRKAEIRKRMAETGEPYAEARRKVIEGRSRRQPPAAPEKVYVLYTYTRQQQLEFDASEWMNALGHERQRMVEHAVGEEFEADFDLYGGQGIAECLEYGELDYTSATDAELHAGWEAEAIELAIRAYAGIDEDDEWPEGMLRPIPSDSYEIEYRGVNYVVLRRQRSVVAVFEIDDGAYKPLKTWPKQIETR